jgi:hypothetical protein
MAHSISRRRVTLEQQLELAEAETRARPVQERMIRDAKLTIAVWNVRVRRGAPIWFFPTIRAAITAKRYYLACICPGCRVRGSIDLRPFAPRAYMTVAHLIPHIICSRCRPNGPHVQIIGLRRWKMIGSGGAPDHAGWRGRRPEPSAAGTSCGPKRPRRQ